MIEEITLQGTKKKFLGTPECHGGARGYFFHKDVKLVLKPVIGNNTVNQAKPEHFFSACGVTHKGDLTGLLPWQLGGKQVGAGKPGNECQLAETLTKYRAFT